MRKLREDEIEALLKFDGARLVVFKNSDLLAQASHTYTAIIYVTSNKPDPCIARGDDSRVTAVRKAWEVYLRYKETPDADKESGYWMYDQATSAVTRAIHNQNKEQENE